jgi:hypothetical protein
MKIKKTLPLPLVDFRLWLHNVLGINSINVRNNKFIDKFRKNSEGGRKRYLGDLRKMDYSATSPIAGTCEHDNEPSDNVKG